MPFIVAYPGGNKIEIDNILKKVEAEPEIINNQTINKCWQEGTDWKCDNNRRLSDIVKKIIETQYSGQ